MPILRTASNCLIIEVPADSPFERWVRPQAEFGDTNPDAAPKVADRAIRASSRDFQSQTRQPRGLVGFLDAEAKMPRCIEDESYLALASAHGRP